jgi:2-methylcitrate dehydratase PrpD
MPQLIPTPQEVKGRSSVEEIAVFAASARTEHLRSDARQLFKRNILDSLGCAIAGLKVGRSNRCVNSSRSIELPVTAR